jgi:hypothetical protein
LKFLSNPKVSTKIGSDNSSDFCFAMIYFFTNIQKNERSIICSSFSWTAIPK